MTVTCASCGKPFEATRTTARYCSGTCRQRALEKRKASVTPPAVSPDLVVAVRRDLETANRLDTPLGQTALRLAERMVSGFDTGSAVAALSRELRSVLAEVLADAPRADRMDELAERRRRRVSA